MKYLAREMPMKVAAQGRQLIRCASRIPVLPIIILFNSQGLILDHGHALARVLPAMIVAAVFAVFGYLSRGVTRSGAVGGALLASLIYLGLGPGGFVVLFMVFAVVWLTTRIGYKKKRQLGLAENRRGRNAGQVFANLIAPASFSVLALFYPEFKYAAVAAMAEATADTSSSEIGEALSRRAWLVTTLRAVKPGTNGAVSLPGTLTGIATALLITYVAVLARVVPSFALLFIAAAGYLGTVLDSLLGATVEPKHWLNNNGVNFVSTLSAGLIALAFPN